MGLETLYDPSAVGGLVTIAVRAADGSEPVEAAIDVSPDEARLYALALIRAADEADRQDW